MQTHFDKSVAPGEEFPVRAASPALAVVLIGPVELYVEGPEDADRLIKAAVTAKRLMEAKAQKAHADSPRAEIVTPVIADSKAAASADTAWEVHEAHANRDGKLTAHELSARLAAMEPRVREHLLYHINGYCPAALLSALESEEKSRPREPGEGGVLFPAANPPYHMTPDTIGPFCGAEAGGYICNAQEGHDGPDHVAYGSEDQECHRWPVAGTPVLATDDEWCDSVLPLRNGGEIKCMLDMGHDGAHSALDGKCRWLGHGADARDENGDKIAPASVSA